MRVSPICVTFVTILPARALATDSVTIHGAFFREVHTEIQIAAPADAVWAELTDFAAMPSWSRSLQSMEGDFREGGHVVVQFMDQKGKVGKYEHDLIVWEAGRAFGWSDPIISGLRDHHVYRITPTEGGCRFTQDDQAKGSMTLLLGGVASNFMIGTYPVFNASLKARAEARIAADAPAPL